MNTIRKIAKWEDGMEKEHPVVLEIIKGGLAVVAMGLTILAAVMVWAGI